MTMEGVFNGDVMLLIGRKLAYLSLATVAAIAVASECDAANELSGSPTGKGAELTAADIEEIINKLNLFSSTESGEQAKLKQKETPWGPADKRSWAAPANSGKEFNDPVA